MEKGLTYVELYALLAVALKDYHAQQMVEEVKLLLSRKYKKLTYILDYYIFDLLSLDATDYRDHSFVIHSVDIRRDTTAFRECRNPRGPCVSFLEEAGQRHILQTVFEYCNVEDTIPEVMLQARPSIGN